MKNTHPPYVGALHMKALSKDPIARKAKTAINHQRCRCNSPQHPYYKYYGAKGIRVEYDTREFMGWYIAEYKKYQGSNPTIGRIDHSKNYTFDNIHFESREENSGESRTRNGADHIKIPVYVIDRKSGKCVGSAPSIMEASDLTGVSIMTISRHVNGHFVNPWGPFIFTSTKPKRVGKFSEALKFVRKTLKISVIKAKDMKEICIVSTLTQAEKITGVHRSHIGKYCNGTLKESRTGYTFRYVD